MEKIKFSVIIPAYNEQDTVLTTINKLKEYLQLNFANHYEIIVVNDGSNDKTAEILNQMNDSEIKVINHPYNKGYGASIKTAVAASIMNWILVFDADGQHKIEDIGRLIQSSDGFDMVVGSRQGYKGPLVRQPGKKIILWVAQYLVEKKIPDLNSGLRLIKKEYFNKYAHLLPSGFSWTTTITLAFLKENLNVDYIPIEISKRQGGRSMVKTSDAVKALMLILRMIMLFSPLRVFLPVSFVLFAIGCISAFPEILIPNINDSTILLFISSLIIFFFGTIADQIAAIRREINK